MDKKAMYYHNLTIQEIHFTLTQIYKDQIKCYYSDINETQIIFKIQVKSILNSNYTDETDNIYYIKSFQEKLLNQIVLRGIHKIQKVNLREINNYINYEGDNYKKNKIYVLDTVGSNLSEILTLDFIDYKRTYSNNISEMMEVLGIEAARKCLFNEIREVMEFGGTYINHHHIGLLCDRMTTNSKMVSVFRHGINNDDIGPIAKASFEETPEMFLEAARHAELDQMRGVSANVMCGQLGFFGTSSFQVLADINSMLQHDAADEEEDEDIIDTAFDETDKGVDDCAITKLSLENNAINISSTDMGNDETDYDIEF